MPDKNRTLKQTEDCNDGGHDLNALNHRRRDSMLFGDARGPDHVFPASGVVLKLL